MHRLDEIVVGNELSSERASAVADEELQLRLAAGGLREATTAAPSEERLSVLEPFPSAMLPHHG
jgi:hypothetical protein